MNVILLERVARLGQIGEVVRVKDGFARNFLLPQGKALRATKDNRTKFESMKVQLEARNLELKAEAAKVGETLAGTELIIVRQAGETGHLYGSVSTRDLAEGLVAAGFTVSRQQILLNQPLKTVGVHEVSVSLHPEVAVTVLANIARSAAEAVRQSRGEDLSVNRDDDEDEDFEAEAEAEEETDGEAA